MKVKLNGNKFFEVSSDFGDIDSMHSTPHTGIDLVMESNTALFSPTDGVVSKVVDYGDRNIGKGLFIKTDEGESLILGHLNDIRVDVGEVINKGDFIALSGNTGRSSGAHLHLGLKDANGNFVDPDKYLNEDKTIIDKFFDNGMVNNYQNSTIEDKSFMKFINDWREDGFWIAMYDKPFFEAFKDFFAQLFRDFFKFLLSNGDLFFLMPAIILMFGTFIIGRNKYSKFIIPLWFAYFISTFLNKLI